MSSFHGQTLSWALSNGVAELTLHREPCNEIGTAVLADLEHFVAALPTIEESAAAVIIASRQPAGFCAGADLRELYAGSVKLDLDDRVAGVRSFLHRIHAVLNAIDTTPLTTIAAVQGVCFGGGFELALACDLIIADRTARFAFPELRLGLIPGFGGIPRLKRDLGNAIVRDILLTGRSINAARAQTAGLASQVVGDGEALRVARATAAQTGKFDRLTSSRAKQFIKPFPREELLAEIDIFCELFRRPVVQEALRKFVESTDALPYLP